MPRSSNPGAAFFDLDRTLIRGPSGPVFARHLRAAGEHRQRDVPGVDVLYRLYEMMGETLLSMQAARAAVRSSRGLLVDDVRAAAESAADELAGMLQPYARAVIDEHRSAGRAVVMTTTSPEPLVAPLAERLELDGLVATKWHAEDGRFTGAIDGPFVWGRDKLAAIRAWAREHGADLRASYAYSDSYYDAPLLASVGNPVAVNPDLRLEAVARLRGWPIRHFDVPEGVPKLAGQEPQSLFRPLQRPELVTNARFDIQGTEHIPRTGPAIVVFNHRSYFDGAAVGLALAKTGRSFRFLGKKEVFDAPVLGQFVRLFGGIRVDRGTGSDQPLDEAIRVLRAGDMILMAPQGTIPRGYAFFEPELQGRWGAARLAHATRAPVIPLGLWGTEVVWPRSARLPNLSPASRPLITVRVGPPVELEYDDVDADTKRIMAAIVDQLPDEARLRKEPTEAELARTFPPGYKGDPTQELSRRPGTDT